MRIAILTPTYSKFSGIDRVVEQQALEFTKSNNKVEIYALAADLNSSPEIELKILGMPHDLFCQRIYRLLFPLDLVKTIKWLPSLKGFDVIYSHQYPMNWLAYLAKHFYKIKYVFYNHGIAPAESFSNLVERTYLWLINIFTRLTIKNANKIISISQYLKTELKEQTGRENEVIYNKIDVKRFNTHVDSSIIRHKYGLQNEPVILYIGRISPHKGIHLLIKSFKLVVQKIPEAKLIVVGKHTFQDYSRSLRKIADESVIFADYVTDEDIPGYYAACDVYASATLWEGFNLPLVEAQLCGKPVVAFDIGPHPEVVINNQTGFLVPAKDTDKMAEAIITLLTNNELRKKMGNDASKMAAEKFT